MKRVLLSILGLTLTALACNVTVEIPTPEDNLQIVTMEPQTTTDITVYFMDVARYQVGTEPYEKAVSRVVPIDEDLPRAVLTQLFLGPTPEESAAGLQLVLSGATGFSNFTVDNGVARLYLTGTCNSGGSTYTIANLVYANLAQFPEIQWIKIYDENGETETPDGQSGSIPFCLEP